MEHAAEQTALTTLCGSRRSRFKATATATETTASPPYQRAPRRRRGLCRGSRTAARGGRSSSSRSAASLKSSRRSRAADLDGRGGDRLAAVQAAQHGDVLDSVGGVTERPGLS
jgi:hypothetical protein